MRYFFLFSWLIHSLCGALTLEEKVGQLLIVHFNGREANEEAKALIQELHVSGFIYYNWANGLENPKQIQELSHGLQKLSTIPLWIMLDQEGGPVTRLDNGFYKLPGQREISATGHPIEAYKSALKMGMEMKAVGINMNLAPVVDVSSDPATSMIAKRTYGDDPDTVILYAAEAVRGYNEVGIVSVLKHFPGYGNVQADPHASLSLNYKSRAELEEIDLKPFKILSKQSPAMMTAHIRVPVLDHEHCATLSKKIITDLLRNEIGYNGLIITDSLAMQGLLDDCNDIEEAAIQAVNAGCDLLILGGKQLLSHQEGLEFKLETIRNIHGALVQAVKNGIIAESRLDESVDRILAAKKLWIR